MAESLNLFRLGLRGVNVVTAPTHLTDDELTAAQNAEWVPVAGEGAIDQRPGMSHVNAVALPSGIVAVHSVLPTNLWEKTPVLYVGMYTGSTHNWRKSTDGVTWTNADTPAKPFSHNLLLTGFFKNFAKCVTLNGKMYYCDGNTPIGLHEFDGSIDKTVSVVPSSVVGATLLAPGAFLQAKAELENFPGGTTYTYKLVAKQGSANNGPAGTAFSVVLGPAALNTSNYIAFTDDLGGATHYSSLIASAPGATSFDVYRTVGGATQGKIGTIPIVSGAITRGNGSGATGSTFVIPTATAAAIGGSGSNAYAYLLVSVDGANNGPRSAVISSPGHTTLPGVGASIRITLTNSPANPSTVNVYRYTGVGLSEGLIGQIVPPATTFSDDGNTVAGAAPPAADSGLSTVFPDGVGNPVFSDAGLVGDGTTAPTTASGGTVSAALAVIDMITDGNALYLAVIDQNSSDPTVFGRILQYFPLSGTWAQIGATFPTASGNGAPAALLFYDGALSYGTYIGITSANTSFLTGTQNPLPAGGIAEVHTTAASFTTTSLVNFLGALYAGYVSLVAGTAGIVAKRAATAGGTWSTARTGPATAQFNGYTSLCVFNGLLFAGWTSGGGATAARIESTPDGSTWTNEISLATTEVVCQMIVFNGALYAVLGRTGASYNTTSRLLQRSAAGTWTEVDNPSDDLAGCIGVVYV